MPHPPSGTATTSSSGGWEAEAAYGFPVFGGRFTASPQVGFGLSDTARDYRLGWKVTPEGSGDTALSFGLTATRHEHEGAGAEAEHRVGIEFRVRW